MKIVSSFFAWIAKKKQRREMKKKGLIQSKKRLTQEGAIGRAAEESRILGILILFTVWCFCVAVLVIPPFTDPESILLLDKKAQASVYAEFDFSYVNEEKTDEKKAQAIKKVPLVYKIDYNICDESVETTRSMFDAILKYSDTKKANNSNIDASSKLISIFKALSPEEQNALVILLRNSDTKEKLLELLQTSLFFGVINKDEREKKICNFLRIHKENIKEKAKPFISIPTPNEVSDKIASEMARSFSPENRDILHNAIKKILISIIKDNLLFDQKLTDDDRITAANQVIPIRTEVKTGDIVVEKGKIVDHETVSRYDLYFKKLSDQTRTEDFYRKFFVSAFLCMLLMCLSAIYIGHIHPEIIESNHKMGLIATVVIISVLMNYFTIEGFNRLRPVFNLNPHLISCVIPITMVSIILSPMVGLRVAHYAGLFVSIMAAMQMNNSFPILLNGMLLCGISGFVVRHKPNHRSYFLSAAAVIAVGTPLLALLHLWAIDGKRELVTQIIAFGVINGIITAIVSLGFLFILEVIFQISSDMTLLLLCDYNHPLLKRLQLEAPGTYHHSLVVSTLAEHAAQAIGANPIRARVAALFHDIGKVVKPEYFTENQHDGDSKHSRLNPRMSSLIILNHVKEGTDLALKFKLRKIIRDGIQQHHGTDIVFFFYNQALEEARQKNTSVDEHDYRYPGPLPREKEVVILSLADASEAASRSLQKPTPPKIDALVWEIFRKRIRNGQLDNANLTFGELKKVRESFVSTLTTMMHGRISYPKEQEDDDEGDLFMATAQINGTEQEKNQTAD